MPGADGLAALAIADSLCHAVADLGIEDAGSKAADILTISIGVACHYPVPGADLEELVRDADEALHAAKRSGRNRTEKHTPRPVTSDLAFEGEPTSI